MIGLFRALLIGSLLWWMTSAASPAASPHIVLFVADDFSWHDCGAYGSTVVHTPNIDRLAREGLTVRRAFAASPTCTPSRAAIFTGLMPMRNGAHSNHSLVREGVRTLPAFMKDLGYRVVIAGKTHIGPRDQFPFEYLTNSNVMPPGKRGVLWTDLNTTAVDQLLAKHDARRPLCLVVCSHSPHVYWKENEGYDPTKITLPPFLLDTPETRQARCRYYSDVSWMDKQVGEVSDSLRRHGYVDNTLFIFTADQGAQWPFGKWNLYDEGIRAPLLIRWPGKIKPAATTDAMISLVDILPTMVEIAGGKPMADWDGRSFLNVLLGKTNHHRAEIYATHTGDKEMNRTPMRSIRTDRFKYILNLIPETRFTSHISEGVALDGRDYWDSWVKLAETDRKAAAVISRYRNRPREELYDVLSDPFELKNLASDSTHARTLAELREKVRLWRLQQGEDLNRIFMPEDGRIGPLRYAD
ncbi:MAG TPA: sulfatase [Candidatus Acidoferrum sp.]|nr:sulfatase [Candidatus Acidoferrum sp.]